MDYSEALARAAAAHGIEPEYTDIWGHVHTTSEQVAKAILGWKGFAAGSTEEIERGLEADRLAVWSRAFDPALVVNEDADVIALRIPSDRSGASVKLEIRWENGELEHHWFWLPELATIETAVVEGREFLAKRVTLPRPLRLGYHQLKIYWVKDPELEEFGTSKLIVCPRRSYSFDQRVAGVALSLYGLRSSRNWGCGDFTDLYGVIDRFAPAGAAFIALNPLQAIPNRQPYNTSPYLPSGSLYRNFLYLDVERVGPLALPEPQLEALRATEFVEYERVAHLKLSLLRGQFRRFMDAGGSGEFATYVEAEGSALHNFALYCALDEDIHARFPDIWLWTDWPVEYRDSCSPAVQTFAQQRTYDVLFYKFLQWHVDRQLAAVQTYALEKGMKIGLYHDLALATDRYGSDLWAHRSFYVDGCRVGAPPDDFSPNGQDWAFPPPNRDTHRADGYQLFAQSIRKNARHGGALRIDHVMRFFRLYWIADGMSATEGAYVRDYAKDLLGILALESVRGKFVVIGEDLGTVTDEVRHALTESGILSYRVFWFERNPDGRFRRPEEYPAQAAVATTTHDLPTLAGFAGGHDIAARENAGLIDKEAARKQWEARAEENQRLEQALAETGFPGDPIGFLLSTPCAFGIINQEDLTGETEQQNLPGSTWQYPNWRRKMKVAVEDLGPLADRLAAAIERSRRK